MDIKPIPPNNYVPATQSYQAAQKVQTPQNLGTPQSEEATYRVDLTTHRLIVSIINPDTGDVIREIPPKEMQAFVAQMNEALKHMVNASA